MTFGREEESEGGRGEINTNLKQAEFVTLKWRNDVSKTTQKNREDAENIKFMLKSQPLLENEICARESERPAQHDRLTRSVWVTTVTWSPLRSCNLRSPSTSRF